MTRVIAVLLFVLLTGCIKEKESFSNIPGKETLSISVSGNRYIYAPLSFTAGDADVAGVVWDFGDGTQVPGTGGAVAHRYKEPGVYTVTLSGNGMEQTKAIIIGYGEERIGTPGAWDLTYMETVTNPPKITKLNPGKVALVLLVPDDSTIVVKTYSPFVSEDVVLKLTSRSATKLTYATENTDNDFRLTCNFTGVEQPDNVSMDMHFNYIRRGDNLITDVTGKRTVQLP